MAIPAAFLEESDWHIVSDAVREFGRSDDVTEDDLLAACVCIDRWRSIRTLPLFHYADVVWALGEAFRQILQRNRRLRRSERFFSAVRAVCLIEELGRGRESLVMLLGQYGGGSQVPTLIRLLEDPDVDGHAVYALRLIKAPEAAEKVRPFLNSPKPWVRREASKYFEKIEARGEK